MWEEGVHGQTQSLLVEVSRATQPQYKDPLARPDQDEDCPNVRQVARERMTDVSCRSES